MPQPISGKTTSWRTYQEVANHVVEKLFEHFGIEAVLQGQKIAGASGATYKIDGKAEVAGGQRFYIVEARRHLRDGITQEEMGGIAYRVTHTGAESAFTVAPLELQSASPTTRPSGPLISSTKCDTGTRSYTTGV